MMFFRISSVPPAMRRPADHMTDCWKPASRGASSGSERMPYWSSTSIASDDMAWSWLADTILPMDASGPGVWPRESAVMERKRVSFSPSA